MGTSTSRRLRLGEVLVDLEDGTVQRDGERVNLTPKQLHLLGVLVESAPRVVTKNHLLDAVWADSIVAEAALPQCVMELRKALGDEARRARFIETVARRGYRLVAPVEWLPEGASAAEASDAVAAPTPATSNASSEPAPRWRSRWLVGAVAVAVAALTVASVAFVRRPGAATPAAPSRRTLVVLPFRQMAPQPDKAWLGAAFPDLLRSELGVSGRLRVVTGERTSEAVRDLALAPADEVSRDKLTGLHAIVGAHIILVGSYLNVAGERGPHVRVDTRVVDAQTGETLVSFAESAPEGEILALLGRMGERLRADLGLGVLSPAEVAALRAMLPGSPRAAQLRAEGLTQMRLFNFTAARDLLERAAAEDPQSPLAHLTLAEALDWLGFETRALASFRQARALAGDLTRDQQVAIEESLCERSGDWPRAVTLARALHAFYPDDLETGLSLVSALAKSGDIGGALATLGELRRLPPPLGEDPRIDLAEAWIWDHEPARRLALARRAAQRASASGARLLLAAARVQEGMALAASGELGRAEEAMEEARRLRAAAGDLWGVAKTLQNLGKLRLDRAEVARAEAALREAREITVTIGAVKGAALARRDLAAVLIEQDRLSEARSELDEALRVLLELNDHEGIRGVRLDLARVLLAEGRLEEAETAAREVASAARLAGAPVGEAKAESLRATALLARGRIDEAAAATQRAASLLADCRDRPVVLRARIAQARVVAARGQTAEALGALSGAATEADRAGLTGLALEVRTALGETELKTPSQDRARAALGALEDQARAHGLLLLARRAAAHRASPR